uniref:histone deacetylase complex subunit SAP18 n=1 Tax=Myxine glutinosa TaxID=7769 RepID=UPI00358EB611
MALESTVTQGEIPAREPERAVDRERTCPLLLRVFVSDTGRHHRAEDFVRGTTPGNELQIYTWMDCSLRELSSLVREVNPESRKKGTEFKFAIVYPDPKYIGYRVKEIGSTISGRRGLDDHMTLSSQKFHIGDFLDVAVIPPGRQHLAQPRLLWQF